MKVREINAYHGGYQHIRFEAMKHNCTEGTEEVDFATPKDQIRSIRAVRAIQEPV